MIKAEDKALHVRTEGKRKEIAKWNASIDQKETDTEKRDTTLGAGNKGRVERKRQNRREVRVQTCIQMLRP